MMTRQITWQHAGPASSDVLSNHSGVKPYPTNTYSVAKTLTTFMYIVVSPALALVYRHCYHVSCPTFDMQASSVNRLLACDDLAPCAY